MATQQPAQVDIETLKQFHPLSLVPEDGFKDLLATAQIVELKKNQILFKKPPEDDTTFYLLEGEIEVRESFDNRRPVLAGSEDSRTAIEELARKGKGATVRALGAVRIVTLSRDAIDAALADATTTDVDSDGGGSLDVQILSEDSESLEEARFDDAFSEDWMANILDAPLLSYLSASDIQRCFMELERIETKDGEEVITAGTRGEYFYILMQGEAEVITEASGPFGGQTFDLTPGQYFGEEALIADTIRNATIRMVSDGAVGRLNREQFNAIFRNSLVQTIAPDKAQEFLEGQGIEYEVLDVRFPPEFRHGHREGAKNLPIVMLRKSLRDLNRQASYLVTPEGGRRSDLAVFLLRQAGLNAYLLTS